MFGILNLYNDIYVWFISIKNKIYFKFLFKNTLNLKSNVKFETLIFSDFYFLKYFNLQLWNL